MNILQGFIISIFTISYAFKPFFLPISRKINIQNLNTENTEILQKINGFYGLIGPDVDIKKTKSLMDLFMGNGMIQGIFIENGEITFVKNYIQTDKHIIEEFIRKPSISSFPKKWFPNMLGVANTAFLDFNNHTYVLFERDQPYEIDINFKEKQIKTIGKRKIDEVSHFSAHSKLRYTSDYSYIETIDYDVLNKKTTVYQLDSDFRILSSIKIPMKYKPIIHDFISAPSSVILLNSPFLLNVSIFPFSRTIELDKSKSSIFYVVERNTGKIVRYYTDFSFFIFHFADVYETETATEIYASVYDSLDFSKLDMKGKYRKITLDKKTKKVIIEKKDEFESMNVEFPVTFFYDNKKKIMMRYVEKDGNTGFVICHKLEIEKRICFEDRCICGEPSIITIDEIPYAMFFTMDKSNNGYFIILNLITETNIEINLNHTIEIGFHSYQRAL
jgi:carotenoid cleavage dioxygenase-like enzyme